MADPGGEARHLIARVWRELPAGVADARGLTREDVDDSYVEFFRRWASRFRNEVELRAGFTSFLLTGDPLVGLEGGARERLDSKGKGRATEADINDHIAEPPDTTRVPLPSIVFGVDDQPSRIPSASEDKTDDPADDLAARQQALGLLAAGDVVGLQFAEDKAAGDGWKATVLDHLVGWGISSPEQAQADLGTMITVLEQARVTINFKAHEWIQEFAGDFERAPESYLNSWERGLRPGGASTKGVLDNVEKSTGGYLRSGRVAGQDADRIAAARIRIQTHLLDPKSDGFVAAGRPRYGAVDYARRTAGGAPAYGTSFFVVKEHVKHRALFVSADSFAAVGGRTTTTYSHIGKLLTHSAEGQLRRLHQYATSSRPGRLTADDGVYFEAQLYTPVRFDRDVAEINVDMAELSSIDDETLSSTIAAMQQFADRYGVKLVIRPWTLEVPFGEGSTSVAEDDDGVTRLVREIVKVAKARNAAGSLGLDVHVEGGGNGSIGGRGAHASGLKRASAVGELIQRKLDVALPADRVSTSFVTVLQPTSRGSALRDGVTGPRAEARRRASVRVEKRPKPAVSTHVLMPFDERSQELSAAQRADLDRFAVALVQRARQVIADGGSGLIVNADGGGNGGRFSRGPVVVGTKRATAALNYLRAQIEKQPGGTPRASDLVTVSDRPTSRGADLKDELAHFDDNQQRRTVLLTVHPRPARRDLQDADGGTGRDLITEQPRAMASLPADAATRSDPADKVALLRDRGDTTPEFDGRSEDSDIYVTDDESEVQARADRGREPSRSADADAVTPAHSGFDAEDSPKESWVSTAADLPPSWRELKEQVAKALREYEAIRAEFPELCDDDSDSNPSALELRDGEAVSLRVSGVGDGKSSPDPGSKQKSYSPASDYSPLLGGHSSAGSGLGERSPSHAADSTSSASLRDAGVVLGGAAGSAWAGSSNGGRSGLPVTDQSEDRSMGSSGNSRSSLSQSASGPGSNVHAGYLHLARKADPVANAGGAQE
ncbi:DUF3626 domain-containing protein [Mycolicibacterium vaccae]|uniref:DUF3626 domain-containing protein n=1 Tax=Mycolicibacterium vaccae TaxID=1810 RepID=UPI0011818BEE|nr:DUF3626 domain-containing protein [Mycolicibacterium vaccae]